MSRNEYLTTGEVARMMGTTKNTLFHYDQLGIFSPEARGDNDYRYYTVRQMDVLDAIITPVSYTHLTLPTNSRV